MHDDDAIPLTTFNLYLSLLLITGLLESHSIVAMQSTWFRGNPSSNHLSIKLTTEKRASVE